MQRYLYNYCQGTFVILHANLIGLEINSMSKKSPNLLEEFSHVQKLLSKYQLWYYRKFGPTGDPHRGQGRVLAILKLQPEISQKELGYLLDMRNQSLGELLSKLEKSGAITREPSEEDRRSMNIKLTEAGTKLIKPFGSNQDNASKIFDCLSLEDQAKLHEILDCLSSELEKLLCDDEDSENENTKENNRHRKSEIEAPGKKPAFESERQDGKRKSVTHREKQKEGVQK